MVRLKLPDKQPNGRRIPKGWRRRVALMIVGVVTLSLCAVGGLLSATFAWNQRGLSALSQSDYVKATSSFAANRWRSFGYKWITYYNLGVAQYLTRSWELAAESFTVALETVPEESKCLVALNLAWTLEAKGDALKSAGRTPDALAVWDEAKRVVAEAKCEESPRQGASEPDPREQPQRGREQMENMQNETAGRLQAKIDAESESAAPQGEGAESEGPTVDEKLEEVKEANQKAEEARQRKQEKSEGVGSPSDAGQGEESW